MKYILIFVLAVLLFSCASQKLPDSRSFTVTAINGDQFTARSGNLVATFTKLPGDSIYIGKTIPAARAKRIR